ncbi:alpha/beta hydrolase [Lentzea albida]|uniref:Pimeloyl-ACP methyl ester carboxylesterase n=1 Tax=Lentzea albida TaxID=65499 RepID=A0A1H9W9F7_9PSEU|nr:alpha/beta hydrolase [Lentzea albida]SES30454.1 Pimeloyl-ACP methyl ester carboxylesterase [Lentzea albida]
MAPLTAALTVACLTASPANPASGADPSGPAVVPPLPERFTGQAVEWTTCYPAEPRFQCATVDAPIDHLHPLSGSMKITFSRFPTAVAAKRRGVLFFNPGGPGLSGLKNPWFWSSNLPRDVLDQYDLIGFDPRGVGRSSPISCGLVGTEAVSDIPYDATKFAQHAAAAKSVADKCAAAGPTAGHISTRATARDMDLIRELLGEDRISYFGTSYGTYLGAVYTQLFPQRSDRFLLDSNVDPARVWKKVYEERTAAAAQRFTHFTEWAAARDTTYRLGDTPAAVERTFWDMVDQLERTPLIVKGARFTEQHARSTMNLLSAREPTGANFLLDLRRALAGEPHQLSVPTGAGEDDSYTSALTSVLCNDTTTWPRGEQPYLDDLARLRKLYPISWDFDANIRACAFWSLPPTEPDLTVGNDVPALLLQNEWDASTPLAPGEGMRRALRASRLVKVEGAPEHGVYKAGNTCATEIANTYLATGVLPAADVTCPARAAVPGRQRE